MTLPCVPFMLCAFQITGCMPNSTSRGVMLTNMNTGNGCQTGWGHNFPVALSISHQLILSVAVDKKGKNSLYIWQSYWETAEAAAQS